MGLYPLSKGPFRLFRHELFYESRRQCMYIEVSDNSLSVSYRRGVFVSLK